MSDMSDYNDYFQRCDDYGCEYGNLNNQVKQIKKKIDILTNDTKRPYFYTDFFSAAFSTSLGVFSAFTIYQMFINRKY